MWETKKLGDVCVVERGSSPRPIKAYLTDEVDGVNWVKIGDTKGVGKYVSKTKEKITKEGAERSRKVNPGDFILTNSMTYGRPYIMATEGYIHDGWFVLRLDDNIDTDFFYYLLSSRIVQDQFHQLAAGAVVKNISSDLVKKAEFQIPPLPEQKRIVAILDQAFEGIDKAIANTQANLASARELFESCRNSIFQKEGRDWKIEKLGDVCENLDRQRVPITKSKRIGGEIPYYGASGIVDYVKDFIFDEDLLLVSEDGANLLARTYPIAFSISGKTWVNNHAHVLKFDDRLSQRFVEFYLNSISLDPYVSGMAQPKLNQATLNKIPVPFPDANDQRTAVDRLEMLAQETSKLQSNYKQKLKALHELKQSILGKAFRGELTNSEAAA